jgi:hypothetical protein
MRRSPAAEFEVRTLDGLKGGRVAYLPGVQRVSGLDTAVAVAHELAGTHDVYRAGRRIARVYADGGVEFLPDDL